MMMMPRKMQTSSPLASILPASINSNVQQPVLVSDKAFALMEITDRRFEKVRRQNKIVKQVDTEEQGGGLTVKFR